MSSYSKKKIISAMAPILSGMGIHKLFAPHYSGVGQILTFHRVLPESTNPRIHNHLSLEISPQHLESTIQFYQAEGYEFVSLDTLHQYLASGRYIGKMVAFTFDDGYLDNYTVAYPILKKYQVPFAIYITTNFPDEQAILWWYLLEQLVLDSNQISFTWNNQQYTYNCPALPNKEAAFDAIRSLINRVSNIDDQSKLLQRVFSLTEPEMKERSKGQAMSWQQIKELSDDPLCTIGAHTVNHYALSRLTTDQLKYEIRESKTRIENHIDKPVFHFAYPFGKAGEAAEREFKIVSELGYKTGVTTRMGNIFRNHKASMECLPRISINKVTDNHVLKLQASGFLPFVIHRGKKVITL